jgi:hypothetical protein
MRGTTGRFHFSDIFRDYKDYNMSGLVSESKSRNRGYHVRGVSIWTKNHQK